MLRDWELEDLQGSGSTTSTPITSPLLNARQLHQLAKIIREIPQYRPNCYKP